MTEHSLEAIRNGDQTDLRRADLSDANLSGADLAWANLGEADLRRADLGGADLGGANLYDADLSGASLQDADLSKASLIDADLRRADLSGAKLSDADLHDADLDGADLPDYQRLPTDGQFVAYKRCRNHVVTLIVPDNADRASSLRGPKCRVEWAVVDEVMGPDGTPCEDTVAVSRHTSELTYVEGKRVEPDEWDDNIRVECTHGIHVFPTKNEAMDWI